MKHQYIAKSRQDALALVLRNDATGLSDRAYDKIATVTEADVVGFLSDVV